MRSMAEHFERTGNPLVSERDREQMQRELLPARGGARKAKPKPIFREKPREYPKNNAPDPAATLKLAISLMDCPPRRYLAPKGRENPRPLPVSQNEQLWIAQEMERNRAHFARLKEDQEREIADRAEKSLWKGFELAMIFAGYGDDC